MKTLRILLIIYAVMSVIGFALMGIDKSRAINHKWRIKEATLFLIAFLGGGIGSTLGMFFFRHKTKHWYFRLFFPLFAAAQTALLFFV
ncbi:MAG: DUF1294 domain-containing protein [Clostridiales bacterium]|nr:DUF1294 domain-containing protein [Clostridiales bacterium]MDY4622755.1 DUF1294 domain-containing protein [Eubacteriales bacterium]